VPRDLQKYPAAGGPSHQAPRRGTSSLTHYETDCDYLLCLLNKKNVLKNDCVVFLIDIIAHRHAETLSSVRMFIFTSVSVRGTRHKRLRRVCVAAVRTAGSSVWNSRNFLAYESVL